LLDTLYPKEWLKDNWCIRYTWKGEGNNSNGGVESQVIGIQDFISSKSKELVAKSEQGFAAWYGPGIRDSAGTCIGATAIFLDLDSEKSGIAKSDAFEGIRNLSPPPSLVVFSGRGFHLYWLLSSFCSDISRLKRITNGLAIQFPKKLQDALDKKNLSEGPAFGLRLVGSKNWKNGFPIEVVITNVEKDSNGKVARYALEDLPEKEERGAKKTQDGGQLNPKAIKDVFLHYFPDLDVTSDQQYMCCPFHDDDTPSFSFSLESGKWTCHSPKHQGPPQGGVISFYAMMEKKSISEAKKDLKMFSTSSDKDAIRDQIKAILEERFLPLYRQGNSHMVGMCRATQELVTVDLSSNETGFLTDMALAMGGSVLHILEEYIPADMMQMLNIGGALRDISLDIFVNLPKDKSFQIIASGVHHIETKQAGWKTFLVDGEDFYENKNMVWEKIQMDGPAYGEIIPKFGQNNFYPFWDHDRFGKIPKPKEVWETLFPLLKENWIWAEEVYPYLIALFTMYVWYHQWFGRPLEMFVCGETATGKSAINEAWFAGTRDFSIPVISGVKTFKSSSLAGFYQDVSNMSRLLSLDEIYDSKNPAAHQLMEALRNMDAKDFAIKRGTPNGKMIQYNIRMPVVWSAIKPPELEQDLNRKIMIYMKKTKGAQDPWDRIWMKGTDPEVFYRMQAALPLYLLPYQQEVMTARDELAKTFLRSGKVPFRRAAMLMPLLQIAKVVGLDTDHLAELLTERAVVEEKQTSTETLDKELLAFLLDHKFSEDNDYGGSQTSLIRRVAYHTDLSLPNYGIYYRGDEGEIWLQGSMLVNNLLSKYANFRDINMSRLTTLLKSQPYYKETANRWIGGEAGTRRVHVIDTTKLLDSLSIEINEDEALQNLG